MGKLVVVFKREYLERVRSKWFIIGTVLGPVFFLLVALSPRMFADAEGRSRELAHVDVIDATGTGLGARVTAALHETYPLSRSPNLRTVRPELVPAEEQRSTLRVQHADVLGYLVLDSATVAGESMRYAGRNANASGDVEALRGIVRQQVLAEQLGREGIDAAKVAAFSKIRLQARTQKIGDSGPERGTGLALLLLGWAVALLLYMMIVIYGQTIMRGVMEEKTSRVAEVVVSSVSTDTLLAGKIVGVGLVAITQVMTWIVLTILAMIYGAPLLVGRAGSALVGSGGGDAAAMPAAAAGAGAQALASGLPVIPVWAIIVLLLCFVLGFIFYASLFAAVGAMVNSQEDVQQAATPVMLLLVSSVIFMGPIIANPEGTLARTMSLLPTSAPILMPLRMALVRVPWYELVGAMLGVLVSCIVAIWLSARIYRVGLLMYGKRPTVRELVRWVREAR
jgi:ABC-2 type transport system permease protein